MKTIVIVLLWFLFIGTLATLVSCKSSHHCDAYGQAETIHSKTVSK